MEQPVSFYDEVYKQDYLNKGNYSCDWKESTFNQLYTAIERHVAENSVVVDLGCGTGQLAQCLFESGKLRFYTGYDFSMWAVELAYDRVKYRHGFVFVKADIAKNLLLPGCDMVIMSEVLEHIENDFAVIENIPPKTPVIITLPNYDSEGHVRFFRNEFEIIDRYGKDIRFETIDSIVYSGGNTHFICKGFVR